MFRTSSPVPALYVVPETAGWKYLLGPETPASTVIEVAVTAVIVRDLPEYGSIPGRGYVLVESRLSMSQLKDKELSSITTPSPTDKE